MDLKYFSQGIFCLTGQEFISKRLRCSCDAFLAETDIEPFVFSR